MKTYIFTTSSVYLQEDKQGKAKAKMIVGLYGRNRRNQALHLFGVNLCETVITKRDMTYYPLLHMLAEHIWGPISLKKKKRLKMHAYLFWFKLHCQMFKIWNLLYFPCLIIYYKVTHYFEIGSTCVGLASLELAMWTRIVVQTHKNPSSASWMWGLKACVMFGLTFKYNFSCSDNAPRQVQSWPFLTSDPYLGLGLMILFCCLSSLTPLGSCFEGLLKSLKVILSG